MKTAKKLVSMNTLRTVSNETTKAVQSFFIHPIVQTRLSQSSYYLYMMNEVGDIMSSWRSKVPEAYADSGKIRWRDGSLYVWDESPPDYGCRMMIANVDVDMTSEELVKTYPHVHCSVCCAPVHKMKNTSSVYYKCEKGHRNNQLEIIFSDPVKMRLYGNTFSIERRLANGKESLTRV